MNETLSLTHVIRRESGWYRGDFHAHTHHSDGLLSPPQLVDVARAEGLAFFAITDHNSTAAYPHFGSQPDVLIIPGIEVTFDEGHYNAFGIVDWPGWAAGIFAGRNRIRRNELTLNQVMEQGIPSGWLNSINHPLLTPWAWTDETTDLRHVHCLEIWNDPSWPDNEWANPQAISLWSEWLNEGYRITALGGSDYHRPEPPPNQQKPPERLGYPSTYVYADELSGQAILAGLRQHKAYVSLGPQLMFQATLNGRAFQIGDDIGGRSGEIILAATITPDGFPARAQIVKNGHTIAEQPLSPGTDNAFEVKDQLRADVMSWYRLDITGEQGQFLAITNPIFAGRRRLPQKITFGEFVSNEAV